MMTASGGTQHDEEKNRKIDEMKKIVKEVYFPQSSDIKFEISPEQTVAGEYVLWFTFLDSVALPSELEEDFLTDEAFLYRNAGSHTKAMKESDFDTIIRMKWRASKMLQLTGNMDISAEQLTEQAKLRLEFINELEQSESKLEQSESESELKQGAVENPNATKKRWHWMMSNNRSASQELAGFKKMFTDRESTDKGILLREMINFDGRVNAHLVDKRRPASENNISDDIRYGVIRKLENEILRLQTTYGLLQNNEPDSKDKKSKQFNKATIDIVKKRIKKIETLCTQLRSSDDPELIYKGFDSAQPKAITKKELITELNTLKSAMNSTKQRGGFFNRVTGRNNINSIIESLTDKQKQPGILASLRRSLRR